MSISSFKLNQKINNLCDTLYFIFLKFRIVYFQIIYLLCFKNILHYLPLWTSFLNKNINKFHKMSTIINYPA